MPELKALSLFSGIGGLDLAAEAAGIRTVAMCEIDPFCRSVLRKHWPDVPIYEDVKELRGEDVGPVGIIHGGPPCQPFSVDGQQKGRDDDRYMLDEVSRLVGEIKPLWFVFENVPGIMQIAADDFLCALECHGYSVGIWSYEALSVRAHHRRQRVFFIGCRDYTYTDCVGFQRVTEHNGPENKEVGEVEMLLTDSDGLCHDLPDSDCSGLSDIQGDRTGSESHRNRFAIDFHRSLGKERKRKCTQSRLGLCPDALSDWLAGNWESGIPRTKKREKKDAPKLKALGNAVVPAQAYPIFRAIAEIEGVLR